MEILNLLGKIISLIFVLIISLISIRKWHQSGSPIPVWLHVFATLVGLGGIGFCIYIYFVHPPFELKFLLGLVLFPLLMVYGFWMFYGGPLEATKNLEKKTNKSNTRQS